MLFHYLQSHAIYPIFLTTVIIEIKAAYVGRIMNEYCGNETLKCFKCPLHKPM